MVEKYQLSIENAKKELDSVSYMLNTTLPFIKENRFLIKIFEEVHHSMVDLVRAILQYEYLYKRIRLYQDAESNFETFSECARRYSISRECIKAVKKIFLLMKKHKESPIEFVKQDRFIILSDNLRTESITADILRDYYGMARELIDKANIIFERRD